MMKHAADTGPRLDGLDPLILSKVGGHNEVLIVDGARRRNFERLRHWEDHVGITDLPTLCKHWRHWEVLWLALRCTGGRPAGDGVFFLVSQPAIVQKRSTRSSRMPRGHLPQRHLLANRFRP